MKLSTVAAAASFLSLATSKPLGGNHHHIHKRVLVTETFTEVVTEIEYASTTLYVTAGESSLPTTTHPASPLEISPTPVNTPKPYVKPAAKKKSTSAAEQQPSVPPPAPTTTEVSLPLAPATTEAPPPAVNTEPPAPLTTIAPPPPVNTEPPAPSTTIAPPPPPPSTPEQHAVSVLSVTPLPAPTQAAPPSTSDSGGYSSTANCGKIGAACSGFITFYDVTKAGYGACGWLNDGLSEDIIALPVGMMGGQSNGNPFCGREVAITLDGKTATGKVVDKCMGCADQAIDLSHHLFDQLASEDKGRIPHVSWHFIT